jgi:RHS repeat-associated protein
VRTHSAANALPTRTINEGTPISLSYDGPGNLKDDGTYLYDYDCENRLTRVKRKSDSATIAIYGYNALGWRVKKTVSNSGTALNGTRWMIYNAAWQLLEVRKVVTEQGATIVQQQFVHASTGSAGTASTGSAEAADRSLSSSKGLSNPGYIDDHIAMLQVVDETVTPFFYHADALFNTLAMTDDDAAVVERSQYEPYGRAALSDANGDPLTTSAIGNPLLRQGIPRDGETGNDENRHRWYAPLLGRWAQRDPLVGVAAVLSLMRDSGAAGGSGSSADRSSRRINPEIDADQGGPCAAANDPAFPDKHQLSATAAVSGENRDLARSSRPATISRINEAYFLMMAYRSMPISSLDPLGLDTIAPVSTLPSPQSKCCIVTTSTHGPFCSDVDAGWNFYVREFDCCCGSRSGKQICSWESHYVIERCTRYIITSYTKSPDPNCKSISCPADRIDYDFSFAGPKPDGHVRNVQCFPCNCPAP